MTFGYRWEHLTQLEAKTIDHPSGINIMFFAYRDHPM